MKLLLDTYAFLWWDSEPAQLSTNALTACQDPENTLFLSVASVWEMQTKLHLGRLKLSVPLETMIENQQQINAIEVLQVTLPHVLALKELPSPHKDPFDRLLAAQAKIENAILISNDLIFEHYPVNRLW
jgi:PIN domain nuclease of toxin-antitoxin system